VPADHCREYRGVLGDPAKVAQVVLAVADMDKPPLRLILGSEACAYATAAARTRAQADAVQRELSSSTDRDDASDVPLLDAA
jgi:hypothetical protein